MQNLNLAEPTKSSIKYEKFTFPGGECHVKIATSKVEDHSDSLPNKNINNSPKITQLEVW